MIRTASSRPLIDQNDHESAGTGAGGRATVEFLAVALGGSMLVSSVFRGSGALAPMLTMITPVLAFVVVARSDGDLRSSWNALGLRRAALAQWPLALIVPAMIALGGYGCASVLGVADFTDVHSSVDAVLNLVIGLAIGALLALAEEIGWRGYLLTRMNRIMPPARAALATGFAHGLWHLPLLLMTTAYQTDGSRWIVAPLVVVTVTLAGPFYAHLRLRSGSIWPVALAHSAFNTTVETIRRAAVTTSPAALAYVAGEAGVATVALVALAAVASCRSLRQAP